MPTFISVGRKYDGPPGNLVIFSKRGAGWAVSIE